MRREKHGRCVRGTVLHEIREAKLKCVALRLHSRAEQIPDDLRGIAVSVQDSMAVVDKQKADAAEWPTNILNDNGILECEQS